MERVVGTPYSVWGVEEDHKGMDVVQTLVDASLWGPMGVARKCKKSKKSKKGKKNEKPVAR